MHFVPSDCQGMTDFSLPESLSLYCNFSYYLMITMSYITGIHINNFIINTYSVFNIDCGSVTCAVNLTVDVYM